MNRRLPLKLLAVIVLAGHAAAATGDFTEWFPIVDPADPGFTSSATPTTATLTALDQPIAAGTDIGFASVNANAVADATEGFFFDPASDFTVAIDFDLSVTNLEGFIGLGFGVGEDRAGVNSVGSAYGIAGTVLGDFGAYGAAATNNDVPQAEDLILFSPDANGSLIVGYDSVTGDVTAGVSTTAGSNVATNSFTFLGASDLDLWQGDGLLVSFFLRSDAVSVQTGLGTVSVPAYGGEAATAVFSNFRVVEGAATTIPEPASLLLVSAGLGVTGLRRRRA